MAGADAVDAPPTEFVGELGFGAEAMPPLTIDDDP